jgi:SagB-type dehydrogenase family enzyme
MDESTIKAHRDFLKDSLRLTIDFRLTDQNRGIDPPPLQKSPRNDQELLPLPGREAWGAFAGTDLITAIGRRRSHRRFVDAPLALEELAFLLWATQGVEEVIHPSCALRTVPSAGCRHAFETYLLVSRVAGLEPAVYRYLPLDHALVFEHGAPNLRTELTRAVLNQGFIAAAPVTLVWTVIPYRMEWRYHLAAHRVIAIDAGHVCQNLYLSCEAIGAGTCAVAAYHQEGMDRLLQVDGEDEFTLYLAPVGKVQRPGRGDAGKK